MAYQNLPTHKNILMTVYIIRERKQIRIYSVEADQEVAFLAEKKRKILASGDSLEDAVSRLGALSDKLEVLNALSKG
jgi:hypothetical protein